MVGNDCTFRCFRFVIIIFRFLEAHGKFQKLMFVSNFENFLGEL